MSKTDTMDFLPCVVVNGHVVCGHEIPSQCFLPPAYAVEVMFSSCVCVCVCLSVRAITFEPVDTETSFLVWCYILTTSRSSLSIKVIGSRSWPRKC